MSKKLIIILLCLLIISTSCAAPLSPESAASGQAEEAFEQELEKQEEASPVKLEPEPESKPEPEPKITAAWEAFLKEKAGIDRKIIAYSMSTLASDKDVIEENLQYFKQDSTIVLGDPDDVDAILLGLGFKYPGMQVDVYALTETNGGTEQLSKDSYEKIFSTVAESDKMTLLLSGFVDRDKSPKQYKAPYMIELSCAGMTAVLIPSELKTRALVSDNIATYTFLAGDETSGNPPSETQESSPEKPDNRIRHDITKNFDFLSFFDGGLSQQYQSDAGPVPEHFISEYNREQGFTSNFGISNSFTDPKGNRYFTVSNNQNEDLYIAKLDAETDEFSVDMIISRDYGRDNMLMQLPASDYYLEARQDSGLTSCRLIRLDGEPDSGEEIRWLTNPIVNPANISEQLLFGIIAKEYSYWREPINPKYIVVLKRGNKIANWFFTDEFSTNSKYINIFNTCNVIAGVSTDVFTTNMPYTCSFNGSNVRVTYPENFATYSFDFNNFLVSASLNYDETYQDGYYNTFVYATTDGHYELWKMNERWFHESSTYGYAVYDTYTKRLIDFYDTAPDVYYDVNFVDNRTAAVMCDTWHTIKDENGKDKEIRTTEIVVYDLPTMQSYKLNLPFDDVLNEKEMYLRCYTWDAFRNQHILLAAASYDKFTLLFFSADGKFIKSMPTEIHHFGGKFVWYPAEIHVIADGEIYIRDNLGRTQGFLVDIDAEKSEEGLYLPIELPKIRRLLKEELSHGKDGLSSYIEHDLPKNDNSTELYKAILDAVPQTSDHRIFRIPGTEAICSWETSSLYYPVYDEAFKIKFIYLSAEEDAPPPVLWSPEPESRFIIGNYKNEGEINFKAISVEEDGTISAETVNVSPIYPIYMDVPSVKTVFVEGSNGQYRKTQTPPTTTILSVNEEQYTDMEFEINGNLLTLSYRNKQTDSRTVFAQVVYRNGVFEIISPDGRNA